MNDELTPELRAAVDAVKDSRVQTRLAYGDELEAGQVVVVDRKCPQRESHLLMGVAMSHDHGVEERTLLRVRSEGDVVSCVTLGEDGEQEGLIVHRLSTIRIAVNR